MDPKRLLGLLRSLRLDTNTTSSLASILGRVGARGVVAMARAYLGPEAYEVEARWCRERGMTPCERVGVPDPEPPPEEPPSEEPPRPTDDPPGTSNGDPPRTSTESFTGAEIAIIGMAVNKLVYEAGELALHNPAVASDGRHPEFKLDAHGCPPAISLSHIVAATRVLRGPVAETGEPLTLPTRARLQAARAERYASAAGRFTYLTSTGNRLR